MEELNPLEKTVQRHDSNKMEIVKGLLIPGYALKIWDDARKEGRVGFGSSLLDMVQIELTKTIGYVIAGTICYERASKYF